MGTIIGTILIYFLSKVIEARHLPWIGQQWLLLSVAMIISVVLIFYTLIPFHSCLSHKFVE